MTSTLDSPRTADRLEEFLSLLEDAWVDAEFDAIVAANWDTEPPQPPERPTGLPARWNPRRRSRRPGSCQRVADQVMVSDQHRRQRSPPTA